MRRVLSKMKKSKIIYSFIAVLVIAGGLGICVKAQPDKRSANIKSSGIFEFDNGAAVIDTSDLTYLADEIDLLEDTYKTGTVKALNEIDTYFKADGSTTHIADENALNYENASVLPYNAILSGILNSQSIPEGNNGAVSGNLSRGTAAWVNGNLVVGNGADNDSFYNRGFSEGNDQGYTKGLKDGNDQGYSRGLKDGNDQGYDKGLADGNKQGYNTGFNAGKNQGYSEGYDKGVEDVVNDPAGHGINLGTPVMFAASSYPECIASPATVLPAGTYQCVALLFGGTTVNPRAALICEADSLYGWEAGEVNPADHSWNAWAEMRTHEFTLSEPTIMRCYAGSSTSASNAASFIAVYKTS